MSATIQLEDVSRHYGDVPAVDGVSLSVQTGEFFAMLGPSGSGKTTCLRLIAGFETPDAGRILLNGREVTETPPYERDVNTVFQDYALFPHMSVLENVAYGLRVRGKAKAEQHSQSMQMLELVRLAALAERRPSQLSGGQRQRVALARALINRPAVLLLDEPLGALDLKLREEMQIELKNLQRQLGITFVFVTHDQGEALSMADRVAVFNHGRIEQLDTPRNLYTRPRTSFVARFVGSSNVLSPQLAEQLQLGKGEFSVRPERIRMHAADDVPASGSLSCGGTLQSVQYHGSVSRWHVALRSGESLVVEVPEAQQRRVPAIGQQVTLAWSSEDAVPLESLTPV